MNRRLFLASLMAAAARAHDLYLMPQAFRFEKPGRQVVWFHLGDGFPTSEVAVSVQRLVDARAIGAHGETPIERFVAMGERVAGQAELSHEGTYVLAVQTLPNQIEMAAPAFESYLEHEGLQHVIDWRRDNGQAQAPARERYTKFVKSLATVGAPTDFYKHQMGYPIEILPEADPFALKPGAMLPIRVSVEGEPMEGLQIQAAWAADGQSGAVPAGRTDRQGRLEIAIDRPGVWRLHTVHMRRATTDADWESFWSSLTFETRS